MVIGILVVLRSTPPLLWARGLQGPVAPLDMAGMVSVGVVMLAGIISFKTYPTFELANGLTTGTILVHCSLPGQVVDTMLSGGCDK